MGYGVHVRDATRFAASRSTLFCISGSLGECWFMSDSRNGEKAKLARKKQNIEKLIGASGLFHDQFYVAHRPEAARGARSPLGYFIGVGLDANHQPSADFDPALYFKMYPDVAASGQSALLHYIRTGRAEGRRQPNDQARLTFKIEKSGLFDADFYVSRHAEAVSTGRTPLDSFIAVGLKANHQPSADFDPAVYLAMYPDVAASGQPALLHYLTTGRNEGRRQPDEQGRLAFKIENSGLFDADFYLARYPEARRQRTRSARLFFRGGTGGQSSTLRGVRSGALSRDVSRRRGRRAARSTPLYSARSCRGTTEAQRSGRYRF